MAEIIAVELISVSAKLVSGLDADARGHIIRLDEPKNLVGTDTGMNPFLKLFLVV